MADTTPAWLRFLQGSDSATKNDPAWLRALEAGNGGRKPPVTTRLVSPVNPSVLTPSQLRLEENQDLQKQVERLQRDETQAAIVGAETQQPKGLLGFFQNTAMKAVDNPIARTIFQALSIGGAGIKQIANTVDTLSTELDAIKPGKWLLDRIDEYVYGRTLTPQEREAAANRVLSKIPGSERAAEFATESLGLGAVPATYERPSWSGFVSDVQQMRGAGQLFPEIQLTENAGILEKAWKLPLAFAMDVKSMGGPRGFVRFGSNAMGRKQLTQTLGRQAEDTFRANATRLADETDDAFNTRAQMFAAKVTDNYFSGKGGVRSRGVSNAFKEEFGAEKGAALFKQLPSELKGGLGIGPADVQLGNINAGGYLVDRVAQTIGLDTKVFGSKWNPVVGYMSLKNTARISPLGNWLNKIGVESTAFQNFLRASVNNSNDNDLLLKYQEFMNKGAYDPAGRVAEIVSEEMVPFKQHINDIKVIKKRQPEVYKRYSEMVDDPNILEGRTELDPLDTAAKVYVDRTRELYDNVHARLLQENIPVGYLNEFYPVVFNLKQMKKDGVRMSDIFTSKVVANSGFSLGDKIDVTKPGLVNVPGKGYDPTKDRNIFMVELPQPDGTVKFRSASPKEMRDQMRSWGVSEEHIKYLKTDPMEMLADYSTRVTKVLARKKLVNELLDMGILFRGSTKRLGVSGATIKSVIDQMRPDQLERLTTDFMRDPKRLDEYIGAMNEKLAAAYESGNKETMKFADAELRQTIDALERLGDVYVERVMKPKQLEIYQKKVDAYAEAVDMGDTDAANKLRKQIEQMRRDAMKVVEETPKTRKTTIEANVEKRTYEQYMSEVMNMVDSSVDEVKRRYNLSNISPITAESIKGTARIPDELTGTIGSEDLTKTLGEWIRMNSRYALDTTDEQKLRDAFNSGTQGFRTFATFGRGPGFVVRNAIGAIFNNVLVAGVTGSDYRYTQHIWWQRVLSDWALDPLESLTGKDAEEYLDKLVKNGKLNEESAALARGEIISGRKVTTETVARIKKQEMIDRLSKTKVEGTDFTLADVYEASIEGGVLDPLQSVAAFSGLKRDENLASALNGDVDWISTRNDRKPIRNQKVIFKLPNGANVTVNEPRISPFRNENDPRALPQRVAESAINVGVDIKTNGRTYNLRPVQLVADFNRNTEEYHRMPAILAGMRKYGNTPGGRQNAIANMRLAQFDYSNLTEFERTYFRAILPFYTWTRNNLPLQVRMLANQPGTFNTVVDGWDTITGVLADDNGDMYFMPEYLREAFAFMINPDLQKKLEPLMMVLGADPNNPLAVRLESPLLDINKYLTDRGPLPFLPGFDYAEILSASNPIAKSVIQYIANKNLYTGKTYSTVEAPPWYIEMSKILGKINPIFEPTFNVDKGVYEVDERILDQVKTVLPAFGTFDRTLAPSIEAVAKNLGQDINITESEDKALAAILSSALGAPVSTVTPQMEAGEVASQYRYAEKQIKKQLGRRKISEKRLQEWTRAAIDSGMSQDDIVRRGQALAESGYFD